MRHTVTRRWIAAVVATAATFAGVVGLGIGDSTTIAALPPFAATPATLVSNNPADNTPFVDNGRVEALAQVGDRIIVGGTFTAVRNPLDTTPTARTYLFAYSRLTGAIDPGFAPVLDGAVYALEASADGTSVFVGGGFKNVNGVARTYLVKLNATTGATVTAFTTATNGVVYDFAKQGNNLFVIGWFSKARSLLRGGLIQIDQTTGKYSGNLDLPLVTTRTAWGTGVRTVDVTPDGTKLVIGGNFTSVGGVARDQVAMINLTTNPATVQADWNTNYLEFSQPFIGTYIRDIAISPDGTYFIVGTTWYCCPGNGDSLTRWAINATGTNVQPEWVNFTGSDTITAVAISSGGVVYVGGHMRWMDNRYPGNTPPATGNRYGLAAVDATTGRSFQWAPSRERGYGVLAMLLTSTGDLVIGHDTQTVGGEKHPKLASFPAVGGRAVRRPGTPALPVLVSTIAPGGATTTRSFNGTSVDATAPTALLLGEVRSGFTINEHLIASSDDGLWVYTADAAGRWARGWQLIIADINPATITGMTFNNEILWFTTSVDGNLHRRTMSGDSYLIDPFDVVASGPAVDGRDWTGTSGLFAAGTNLYRSTAAGDLSATPFNAASEFDNAAVTTVVSGPAIDGQNWTGALFRGSAPTAIPYRRNLALGKPTGSSAAFDSYRSPAFAVDGIRAANWDRSAFFTTGAGTSQWWEVDLGSKQAISSVVIWPRWDDNLWLVNPWVLVSDSPITGTSITNMTSATGVIKLKVNGFVQPGMEIPVNKSRRYVRIVTPGLESTGVQLAEFEVFGPVTALPAPVAGENVALRQPATQSQWGEYFGDAMRATDGNGDGNYFNYSTSYANSPDANGAWWQTDLGRTVNVSTVRIWNRTDCCREFLFPAKVFVSATPFTSNDPAVLAATPGVSTFDALTDPGTPNIDIPVNVPVRYVRVQLPGAGRILMLAEVEVLAA
jgi:F5/8 type C domain